MASEETTLQDDTTQASETTASTQTPTEEAAATTPVVETPEATPEEPKEAPKEQATDKPTEEVVEGSILKRETEDIELPESYDWNMPEGSDLSEDDAAQLNKLAQGAKLTAEEAPKAFEFAKQVHDAIQQDVEKTQAEELTKMKDTAREEWNRQPDSDTKTLHMQKFLKQHGMLDHFIDSHYEADVKLMNAMAEAGKLISEATHITGVETAPKSDVLYPNSPELYK